MGLLGGILGGIIGSMFAGTWGAVIGAGIGYSMSGRSKATPATPGSSPMFPLFRAMAKIAKADGVVSPDEAAFVSEILQDFGKDDPVLRKALKAEFDSAKNSDSAFADEIRQLRAQLPPDAQRSALELLCSLARVDNRLDENEKTLLLQAEAIFGLRGFVDNFFNGSRQRRTASSDGGDLVACYKTLGISATATDDEVKTAWKKKSLEFHPDRLAGKGLSEAYIEFAEGEMKKVNLAYETIMKSRKK